MSDSESKFLRTEVDIQHGIAYENTSDGISYDMIWSVYCNKSEYYDTTLVGRWTDEMDGIVLFAGLFSAVVTAFLMDSYKNLQPDPGELTVAILIQISGQLASLSNHSQIIPPFPLSDATSFQVSPSMLRTNVLWFLSLSLALLTAFFAILVKRWSRNYLQTIERYPMPLQRARMRAYLFDGLQYFAMPCITTAIPTILHISLFLFLAGLFDYLRQINQIISHLIFVITLFAISICVVIAILPIFYKNCPYSIPLASVAFEGFRFAFKTCGYCILLVLTPGNKTWRYRIVSALSFSEHWVYHRLSAEHEGLRKAPARDHRDVLSVYWLIDTLMDEPDLERVLEAIPTFFKQRIYGHGNAAKDAHKDFMFLSRLLSHLRDCRYRNLSLIENGGRRAQLLLSVLGAFLNFLASNGRQAFSTVWSFPDGCDDLSVFLEADIDRRLQGHARCVRAAMMCHNFSSAEHARRTEGRRLSYPGLCLTLKKGGLWAGPRTRALWQTRLHQFFRMKASLSQDSDRWDEVPTPIKIVIRQARSLALIDFTLSLIESPYVPEETYETIRLVTSDFSVDIHDQDLESLFYQVKQEAGSLEHPIHFFSVSQASTPRFTCESRHSAREVWSCMFDGAQPQSGCRHFSSGVSGISPNIQTSTSAI